MDDKAVYNQFLIIVVKEMQGNFLPHACQMEHSEMGQIIPKLSYVFVKSRKKSLEIPKKIFITIQKRQKFPTMTNPQKNLRHEN